MSRRHRWRPAGAAKLGYLAGRGFAIETIAAQLHVTVRSAQMVAARWRISFAPAGVEPVEVTLPLQDRRELAAAARARGMAPQALAQLILHHIVAGDLVGAVLGEDPRSQRHAKLGGDGGLVARVDVVRHVDDENEAPPRAPPSRLPAHVQQLGM
ncbi:MAG: hypothetical protein IT537_30565 [Hyphomicrobiales bacterium]|nr:hypothetical protein [Hyphomicrobiales bacterium]